MLGAIPNGAGPMVECPFSSGQFGAKPLLAEALRSMPRFSFPKF